MDDDDTADGPEQPARPARAVGVVIAVAVLVGLAVAGLVYSVIAIPLYVLAQSDPDGLDRPFIRDGFFRIALPAGLLVGLGAGIAVGAWYKRGGRLPTDRTHFHDR